MKVMWCWRSKQDVPMLDEDEYHAIYAFTHSSRPFLCRLWSGGESVIVLRLY
jgi:hypothetical protein